MADVVNKAQLIQLNIDQLCPGRFQPRRDFDPVAIAELADSIRSSGLIQPIVVRKLNQHQYEIIAGERRWRAAQQAGLESVPCLLNNYSDEQAAAVTTIENIQRKDLNPIEEAQSLQRLVQEFNYLHEEVAAVIGKSRSHVSNSLRLLRLDLRVQQLLIEGSLSEGHGKILAGLPVSEQIKIAERCLALGWSVRQLEQLTKKMQTQAAITPGHGANIQRLERVTGDRLGTRVKIETEVNNRSGWLSIQFHDNDILAGILEKMGVIYDDTPE